jgi:hypothetical protein
MIFTFYSTPRVWPQCDFLGGFLEEQCSKAPGSTRKPNPRDNEQMKKTDIARRAGET